jgi:hypothetical protein
VTVLRSDHLTSDPVDDLARDTWPGMAFWSATGPDFTTCRHCDFFEREPPKVAVKTDPNKPARCKEVSTDDRAARRKNSRRYAFLQVLRARHPQVRNLLMTDLKFSVVPSTTALPDRDDLASIRLDQNFAETSGVKRLLTTIPVRRPNPQDFCRTHPSPDYRVNVGIIDLKEDREVYPVASHLVSELAGEVTFVTLFTSITRSGVVFLWPVRLPDPHGRKQEWHRSAREAAEMAATQWVRMQANMSLGAYEITVATGAMADPVWPDVSMTGLIKTAFRGLIVDSIDHPVIKRLRGL